ncbi:amidohydrolase [Thalassotalea sp. 42_200_T64]|nr:amidohydrolase [Thalassotalea sp. 42_200_T64]
MSKISLTTVLHRFLTAAVFLSVSAFTSAVLAQSTVIENINGYTLKDNQLLKFNAIKFSNDKIDKLYLSGEKVKPAKNVNIIDGQGKTLIPGLIDAHGHVLSYGLSLLRADVSATSSEADAVNRVLEYTKNNQQMTWIQGRGWNQVQWPSNQFPTAASLDKHFKDTPVVLGRVDGHAIWVNSKAMQLAGISKVTADVEGGQIIRDSKGDASGVFVDNAMNLIYSKIPALTPKETQHALKIAMRALASVGLTSVHDAGISSSNIAAYKQLSSNNEMLIRVNAMIDVTDNQWQQQMAKGPYASADQMLTINSVKISADGALGSRGAALIADYSDKPHHKGLLLHSEADLTRLIKTSMLAGFQVNTHAIGDNANKMVIDNYQTLIKETKSKHLRHRVEHAQVLRIKDIPRFAENGIIASMQATHATSDKNMAEDRLGSDRIKGAYAWRSLLANKAVIAAGSDFPVESPNPFFGLHASITRQDKQNQPMNGWYSNEGMSMIEAFKSFTLDAAYAGHQETMIGSLQDNKKADFILLDQDIFTITPEHIWQTKVLQTWVNGKQITP